jgi:hypothetical protein
LDTHDEHCCFGAHDEHWWDIIKQLLLCYRP